MWLGFGVGEGGCGLGWYILIVVVCVYLVFILMYIMLRYDNGINIGGILLYFNGCFFCFVNYILVLL